MSFITAHVLDATAGTPADGVQVQLCTEQGEQVAAATTNADGRVGALGPESLPPGIYRITFTTGAYFAERGQAAFHPYVVITFTVEPGQAHYHVPLLLSPYAYTTYRGS